VPLGSGFFVFEEPTSPECYAKVHPERTSGSKAKDITVNPRNVDLSEAYIWRHELDHDVESVFWLLLYWAMVAQPKGGQTENIHSSSWSSLLGDVNDRERLLHGFCSGDSPRNLTHSVYAPLWPLIQNLAEILKVDKRWVPKDDVRRRPEYICEAFQRLILQFIISNRDKGFMTCPVDNSLRSVKVVAQSGANTITPSEERDEWDRVLVKRRRLNKKDEQGEDEDEQDEDEDEQDEDEDEQDEDEDEDEDEQDEDAAMRTSRTRTIRNRAR